MLNIKDRILEKVANGIKANELFTQMAAEIAEAYNIEASNTDLVNEVDKLVASGDIIEIEYTLPSMEYRVKSFYLPKGTGIFLKPK